MLIRQKSKLEQFFYSSWKWVVKQQRQRAPSAMHLAQEPLTNVECSGGSRNCAKETRALKMRSTVAGHWKLTATSWDDRRSWASYNYTRSYWRTQRQPFYGLAFGTGSKLERWKSSISGCLMSWPQIKNCRFKVLSSLILCNNNEPFLNRTVMCDKKWILYDNDDQLSGWTEKLQSTSQSQTCTKKRWSAASLIHYSFLNPRETISSGKYAQQIGEMHQKLQHLQQALLNRKGPIRLHNNGWLHIAQPTLQKLNELGYKVLPHLTIFTWPLTNHFFKHLNNFLQGKCFHNQQEAENAFQEFVKSWSMDFYATGINKLFLIGTMCWL